MRRFIAVLLLLVAGSLQAQTVRFRVACLSDDGTKPIETVTVGEHFKLAFYAQDLRENGTYTALDGQYAGVERPLPRGVYSAYCFVNFDTALCKPFKEIYYAPLYKLLEYKNGYTPDAALRTIEYPTGVKMGALRGLAPPQGTEEFEVCRLRMVALTSGLQNFYVTMTGIRAWEQTTIYQHQIRFTDPAPDTLVKHYDIVTVPVSLTVRPK